MMVVSADRLPTQEDLWKGVWIVLKTSWLMPIALGGAHAIVDASTVTAIFRSTHLNVVAPEAAWGIVLAYDLVAFGSQALLGWCTDRFASPRLATLLGLALTAVSLVCCSSSLIATLACASIGNALFHLGAGANVLRGGLESSAPAGVFVAPGAIGLAFGIYYGTRQGPVWPLLVLALAAFSGLSCCRFNAPLRDVPAKGTAAFHAPRSVNLAIGLLLVSIMVRSLVGMSAAKGYPRSDLLLLGIPGAAFLGKSVGGFIADRLGWLETSVAALLISIPLIASAPPALALLLGLLLFQMTMPVTLTAVARLLPQRLATAFGWTCLALILGALPTMLPLGRPLCVRGLLSFWIFGGTVCLYFGLRLSGVQRRFLASNAIIRMETTT
jgi:MFS transporter, FSR family, fosmidomycin resistance protein